MKGADFISLNGKEDDPRFVRVHAYTCFLSQAIGQFTDEGRVDMQFLADMSAAAAVFSGLLFGALTVQTHVDDDVVNAMADAARTNFMEGVRIGAKDTASILSRMATKQ